MSERCSERKREANRLNALKSTGPKTDAGKRRSSRNATTHGLFCRDLVLPGEDEQTFHLIREGLIDAYAPRDFAELLLVDRIVSAAWKLRRLQSAEREVFLGQNQRIREAAVRMTNMRIAYDPQDIEELPPSEREQPVSARVRAMAERTRAALDAGEVSTEERWAGGRGDPDDPSEKLSRLEQRLESSLHRAMRELERKQKERRRREREREAEADALGYAPGHDPGEPRSPFAAVEVVEEPDADAEKEDADADADEETGVRNEANAARVAEDTSNVERHPPSPGTPGEGGGEGPPEETNAAGVANARNEATEACGPRDVRPESVSLRPAAAPSPRPSP